MEKINLLSIIIPVFNRKELLCRTLQSLNEMSSKQFDLILVDNNSTDGAYEQCISFAKEWNANGGMCYLYRETKPGASVARNKGLAMATTEYVYFFDSDDEISKNFVADMNLLLENATLDMIIFPTMMKTANRNWRRRAFYSNHLLESHILCSMLSTVSMVIKRKYLIQCGGWNEQLATWDDWELALRLLLHHPRIKIMDNKAYHKIYVHDDSITGGSFTSKFKEEMLTLQAVHQLIQQSAQNKRVRRAFLYRLAIFNGALFREDSAALTAPVEHLAKEYQQHSASQCSYWLLRYYASHIGIGAWFLALKILCRLHL